MKYGAGDVGDMIWIRSESSEFGKGIDAASNLLPGQNDPDSCTRRGANAGKELRRD